jgi:hypothetical protein
MPSSAARGVAPGDGGGNLPHAGGTCTIRAGEYSVILKDVLRPEESLFARGWRHFDRRTALHLYFFGFAAVAQQT